MGEEIAAIEGCIATLEKMSEENGDPQIWMMVAALRRVAERLDALDEQNES